MSATVIGVHDLKQRLHDLRNQAQSIAFVPTMGALHEGHLSLVRRARAEADVVLVSIFVNPKQFGPNEDFAKYPRVLSNDVNLLAREQVDLVFAPNTNDIYPEGFQTYVENQEVAQMLCGKSRPKHFRGVLTVVLKLFNLISPDVAVFGKKDYQQLWLIRKMVEDLCLDVRVIGCDTMREDSGLALSSRNSYLTQEQRQLASELYRALTLAKSAFDGGEINADNLQKCASDYLAQYPELEVDYLELRRQSSFGSFHLSLDEPAVMLAAVRLGGVRLIDNIEFGGPK